MERQPPFKTPAGIQIGLLYQPQRPVFHDRDALRLQDALLNKHQPSQLGLLINSLVRRFWAWC
jgi:hypothetical protein